MTSEQMVAAAALGYAVQWVKAFKGVPTWAVQAATVVLAACVYALLVAMPTQAGWQAWARDVVGFGLSALGVASVAGAAETETLTHAKCPRSGGGANRSGR